MEVAPKQDARGCLFYGCIAALVVVAVIGVAVVLVGVAIGIAVRGLAERVVADIEQHSDPVAAQLPSAAMPATDYRLLEQRIGEFGNAVASGRPGSLVLSGDELNALIANHRSWTLLRNKLHVSLADDVVRTEFALPLEDWFPNEARLEDRYVNGAAELTVGIVDGMLVVAPSMLEVHGRTVAAEYLELLRVSSLRWVYGGPDLAAIEDRLESIQVSDGKLKITTNPRK
jgi:hypothetical protein